MTPKQLQAAHEAFALSLASKLAVKLGVARARVTVKAPFEPPKPPSFEFKVDGQHMTPEQTKVMDSIFNSLGAFKVVEPN